MATVRFLAGFGSFAPGISFSFRVILTFPLLDAIFPGKASPKSFPAYYALPTRPNLPCNVGMANKKMIVMRNWSIATNRIQPTTTVRIKIYFLSHTLHLAFLRYVLLRQN